MFYILDPELKADENFGIAYQKIVEKFFKTELKKIEEETTRFVNNIQLS